MRLFFATTLAIIFGILFALIVAVHIDGIFRNKVISTNRRPSGKTGKPST